MPPGGAEALDACSARFPLIVEAAACFDSSWGIMFRRRGIYPLPRNERMALLEARTDVTCVDKTGITVIALERVKKETQPLLRVHEYYSMYSIKSS